jgi:hypothetical protein
MNYEPPSKEWSLKWAQIESEYESIEAGVPFRKPAHGDRVKVLRGSNAGLEGRIIKELGTGEFVLVEPAGSGSSPKKVARLNLELVH